MSHVHHGKAATEHRCRLSLDLQSGSRLVFYAAARSLAPLLSRSMLWRVAVLHVLLQVAAYGDAIVLLL